MYAYLEMPMQGGGGWEGVKGKLEKKWQIPDKCPGGWMGTIGIDWAKLSQFDLLC